MFVNGVEILSNKSGDSVHFGNIRRIDVESGGKDYDIISPPNIHISDTVGTGATAYAVIEGNFKGIDILSGGYDIKTVPNVVITGGNGSGATAQARLKATRNSRLFDAKDNVNDGDDILPPRLKTESSGDQKKQAFPIFPNHNLLIQKIHSSSSFS